MLHFVTSYMKQNKSSKQTLESAQYGLEISFKLQNNSPPLQIVDFINKIKYKYKIEKII